MVANSHLRIGSRSRRAFERALLSALSFELKVTRVTASEF